MRAELDRLIADQSSSSDKAINAAAARISALESEISGLTGKIAERDTEIENLRQQNSEQIEKLQAQLSEAGRKLIEQDGQLADEKNASADSIATLEQQLIESRELAGAREAQLRELQENTSTEIARLVGELVASREEIERLNSGRAGVQDQGADVQGQDKQEAKLEQTDPRDPLRVATVLQQGEILGKLDDEQRDRIATRLIEGDCVASVLNDEFPGKPDMAIDALIEALGSDC